MPHRSMPRGTVRKAAWRKGTYTTDSCSRMASEMEPTSHRLRRTPSLKTVRSSERALKARNHSKATNEQKVTVRASSMLILAWAQLKIRKTPTPMMAAMVATRISRPG